MYQKCSCRALLKYIFIQFTIWISFCHAQTWSKLLWVVKAITENQMHNFPINGRHSHKKYCSHSGTLWGITITVDPRIKLGLSMGDCFVKKLSFPAFLFGDHEFFFTNQTNFVCWSTSPKNSKILMLEVANVIKLTLFSVRSLKTLTPAFSQTFPVTPMFFKILTTDTKGCIIQKSKGVSDVRA